MNVFVCGRGAGKTHRLIQWVKEGEKTMSYPGWSRVILTHSLEDAQRLRTQGDLDYRQVFSVNEWRKARLGSKPVQVAMDNADMILAHLIGQYPSEITLTGRNVSPPPLEVPPELEALYPDQQ